MSIQGKDDDKQSLFDCAVMHDYDVVAGGGDDD